MSKKKKKTKTSSKKTTSRKTKGVPSQDRELESPSPSPSGKGRGSTPQSAALRKGVASTPAVISPYSQYLAEIHRYPLLTKEEEYELAVKFYETKDPQAAHLLVTANLRFVVKIAHEYASYGIKLMDLIQEGNIGLMRAVKTFNPYKDVRLVTYAVWWIRAYIQDYIQHNWSLVKVGTTQAQRKLFYKLNQEKRKLDVLGLPADVKLLSRKLDVKEKEVAEMEKRLSARDLSLDEPLEEGGRARIGDILAAETAPGAEDQLISEQEAVLFKRHLEEFKETLSGRDRDILELRLLSEHPQTLEEIGQKHGITKERVRQLENEIKNRLRKFLTEKDVSLRVE
ncbi:MAG: RNA polymerase factor sigma-32 [Deltaproteobacteria bacterium]|nr:RNA polymerase factor sigma-32 [Deltaproteobacteria bacterium]